MSMAAVFVMIQMFPMKVYGKRGEIKWAHPLSLSCSRCYTDCHCPWGRITSVSWRRLEGSMLCGEGVYCGPTPGRRAGVHMARIRLGHGPERSGNNRVWWLLAKVSQIRRGKSRRGVRTVVALWLVHVANIARPMDAFIPRLLGIRSYLGHF